MKTITDVLASQHLKYYVEKANTLRELNVLWQLVITTDWATQCQIAYFEQGELLLHATNAASATRVRYAIPDIMKELCQYPVFATLKSIVCRVRSPQTMPKIPIIKKNISPKAAKLLKETADCLQHPMLKKALSTLAAHIDDDKS